MNHMIRPLICTALLLTFVVFVPAQGTETFDIATFKPPAGWAKQAKGEGLIFTTADKAKGTFAMLVLYRGDASLGDAKRDFETDWQQFAVGAFGVKNKPEIEPQKQADGWTVT